MKKKNLFDLPLFGVTIVLTVVGVMAVFTASAPFSYAGQGATFRWAINQLKWFILGLCLLFLVSKIDYHFYQKLDRVIVFFIILLLVSVFVPGLGKEIRGTHRWITVGFFQFQPSELAKLGVIIYLASSVIRKKDKIDSFIGGFLPYFMILSLIFFLVMIEPDLGSALVIALVGFVILYAGGVKLSHMLYVGLLGIIPLYFSIFEVGYRKDRIVGFLDPASDPLGIGFQPMRLRIALGSGGIFGLGPGQGKEKLFYLPTPHTDSIFAVIGEEFGLIGTTLIIFMFVLFTIRGLKIAKGAKDDLGKLLAIGLTSLISIQAIINMGVACVILPTTGLALPFISYGGSSLVVSLIAVGILLNVSRQQREVTDA
ncbi:putative lipid II flippase FtsW [Candidatus Aerophobetes bacterium]|nr:putative lipid II flippase FtsW [Candidatus Aerophobetes bacterium]